MNRESIDIIKPDSEILKMIQEIQRQNDGILKMNEQLLRNLINPMMLITKEGKL